MQFGLAGGQEAKVARAMPRSETQATLLYLPRSMARMGLSCGRQGLLHGCQLVSGEWARDALILSGYHPTAFPTNCPPDRARDGARRNGSMEVFSATENVTCQKSSSHTDARTVPGWLVDFSIDYRPTLAASSFSWT